MEEEGKGRKYMMCYTAEVKYCLRAAAAIRVKRWAKRKGGRQEV